MTRSILSLFLLLSLLTACSKDSGEKIAFKEVAIKPSLRPKIVIDAGHGGKDLGATSKFKPVISEKALTLSAALMLNRTLQQMGYDTMLTRGGDFFVPLDLRALIANSNQASLFVSIHYNSAPSARAEGLEVYYYESEENKKRTTDSKLLANLVLKHVAETTKFKSRGVKHGNFAVIRQTSMPAILVESGFLTSEGDMQKIRAQSHAKELTDGIAAAIDAYLKREQRSRRDSNARPVA